MGEWASIGSADLGAVYQSTLILTFIISVHAFAVIPAHTDGEETRTTSALDARSQFSCSHHGVWVIFDSFI